MYFLSILNMINILHFQKKKKHFHFLLYSLFPSLTLPSSTTLLASFTGQEQLLPPLLYSLSLSPPFSLPLSWRPRQRADRCDGRSLLLPPPPLFSFSPSFSLTAAGGWIKSSAPAASSLSGISAPGGAKGKG